jgi:glycosyltransferase involved in cell wall biosynthesis
VSSHARVSVAICLFNSSRYISDTLESVFAQSIQPFEIVLVDDGSTDGTVELIERRYATRGLRILQQPHRGLSHARRLSITSARGDYIAFLDHDDLWLPRKLERQLELAESRPELALISSDCLYIDEQDAPLGKVSSNYGLEHAHVDGAAGYEELLRRGCFVWQSTVLARTDVLQRVGAFDPSYPYIADYDTWLRIARQGPIAYIPEVLAKWRMHRNQFTQRCPEITLDDHRRLLAPLLHTASIPKDVRVAIGDRLLGQHRVAAVALLRQGRLRLAARAALQMCTMPERLSAYLVGQIAESPRIGPRLKPVYRRVRQTLRDSGAPASTPLPADGPRHVWLDGTALDAPQTGYFNFSTELARWLRRSIGAALHVRCTPSGRAALERRLGAEADGIAFEAPDEPSQSPAPRDSRHLEIVIWHGRFRHKHARHVAVIQDLTTLVHPELHTPGNVRDFDDYLRYAQRHAQEIWTISESSRRDILQRTDIFPGSVRVIPMPLHPQYLQPTFSRDILQAYSIRSPYVLSVGCIEPRKNLRRLLRAFQIVRSEPRLYEHVMVFVGPDGWDPDFRTFVNESGIAPHVRCLGFVPNEHLPSLYRFAATVAYPSLYEGFGLPVLEAMSSSAVVVTSDTSSLPEVIGDGITCDPCSVDAIAGALRLALTLSSDQEQNYRCRARARAEEFHHRLVNGAVLSQTAQ